MATAEEAPRKVFIRTYGCQMNVYDSERMARVLAPSYASTDRVESADLILINTCHIREKAAEKTYSELGRLRVIKEEAAEMGRAVKIGVVGCVAQAEGKEIIRRSPAVDLVIGPQSYHRLPELLSRVEGGEQPVETGFDIDGKFKALPSSGQRTGPDAVTAFLTVQEGCDKFCTFCVVPYTRGTEVSRSAAGVLTEARKLIEAGVREITLLGQNVNAWHGEGIGGGTWNLGQLLFALAEIPGLERLRYTTSHPRDMDEALIAAHRDLPQLMPYLHLPAQSGSDRVLKAMNRGYRFADYLDLVERLRDARPDIAVSGDFIVGFPGESEADFEATLALVREVNYASAYSFKYSPRPGTPAAERADQVLEAEKDGRLAVLQRLLAEQQQAFSQSRVGMRMDVLFERPGRYPGQLVGRSPWLQGVHCEAPDALIGRIVPVRIEAVSTNSLRGRLDGGHARSPMAEGALA